MSEQTPSVLPPPYLRLHCRLRHGGPHLRACGGILASHPDRPPLRISRHRRQTQRHLRTRRRLGDGRNCSARVAAHHFDPAIHHHLRRVIPRGVQPFHIDSLPTRKLRVRKRITPSQLVPIVDMLAQHNHLAPLELGEQRIGGRTARAPLRRKQLHQHRRLSQQRQTGQKGKEAHRPPDAFSPPDYSTAGVN